MRSAPTQGAWNQGSPTPSHGWAPPPAAWPGPAAPPSPTPPATAPGTAQWLAYGAIIIAVMQALTFYFGVKYYESHPQGTPEEMGKQIALLGLTVPYLIGGWLIAYLSVGRTILVAAVAAVISVGLMALVAPAMGVPLNPDRDAMAGASIIAFFCALFGSFVGEHTPGHK